MSMSTFDQPVREVLGWLRIEAGLSQATLEAYERDLVRYVKVLSALGLVGVGDVSEKEVAGYVRMLDDLGLASSSVARNLTAVRVFHKFMVAEGLAAANPTDN